MRPGAAGRVAPARLVLVEAASHDLEDVVARLKAFQPAGSGTPQRL